MDEIDKLISIRDILTIWPKMDYLNGPYVILLFFKQKKKVFQVLLIVDPLIYISILISLY